MRYTLVLLVLLTTATPAPAAELRAAEILNTGALACSYNQVAAWANPEPGPIYIRKVEMWHGMYRNTFGDVHTEVFRGSDAMSFARYGQDRYTNPSTPHAQFIDFGEHYILIPEGDQILTRYYCAWHTAGAGAHHVVVVWYTVTP